MASATVVCSKVGNFNPKAAAAAIKSTGRGGGAFRHAVAAVDRTSLLFRRPLLVHHHDERAATVNCMRAGRTDDAGRLTYVLRDCIIKSMCSDEIDFDFDEKLFFQFAVPMERYHILGRHFLVIGIGYQKEHPEALWQLQFPSTMMPVAVYELSSLPHVDEAAFISRRNRFEIYAVVLDPINALEELCAWIAKESGIPLKKLRFCCYWHFGGDAWRHLFEVSSGLRNFLPEGRNFQQVREIANSLDGFRGFGRILTTLFEHAVSVGERVRAELKLLKAESSISLASAAVELALTMYLRFGAYARVMWSNPHKTKARPQILVIGSGWMGMLVIKYLVLRGYKTITLVHDLHDSFDVLDELGGRAKFLNLDNVEEGAELTHKPRSDMASCIAEADIVFTCPERCDKPFILKEDVVCDSNPPPTSPTPSHLKLFVDTSIPPSVDKDSVSQLSFARIFNMDDIEKAIVRNKTEEEEGGIIMERARGYIDEEVGKFESWFNTVGAVHILQSLRGFLKLKYARELEERRPPHIVGSDHLWKQKVDCISSVRAGHYMFNFTAQLEQVLGSCFENLVDRSGYPKNNRDDEEEEWSE